jgi:hypothetical protein
MRIGGQSGVIIGIHPRGAPVNSTARPVCEARGCGHSFADHTKMACPTAGPYDCQLCDCEDYDEGEPW